MSHFVREKTNQYFAPQSADQKKSLNFGNFQNFQKLPFESKKLTTKKFVKKPQNFKDFLEKRNLLIIVPEKMDLKIA